MENIKFTGEKSKEIKKADFHVDLAIPFLAEILKDPELSHASERAEQLTPDGLSKVDIIFASIYRRISDEQKSIAKEGNPDKQAANKKDHLKIIDYYKNTENLRIIEKPEDLDLDIDEKTKLVLHLECGDIITDPEVVDELYKKGVRSVGPMYNQDNHIGGGAGGNKNRGLTSLGKQIIDRMVEKGMIIDVAHANRKTAHDILERVGEYQKSVATHTSFGSKQMGFKQRFITEELLKKIAEKGGVVGFSPAKFFFPNLKEYIDGLKKASDITGSADNLAIGTDFGGLDAQYLFKELDEIGKLSIVAEKLSEQGKFSDEEIGKIMYGNIERIVRQL